MREKGIAELMLIGGIALAVIIGGLFLATKVYKSQRDAARAETVKIQAQFDTFVDGAKKIGEEQEAKTKSQEAKQKEVLDVTKKRYLAELANRDAAIRRLRERPATRPDSSPVPVIAGCAPGTNEAGREWVPLEEYRQLEARAYDDALRLTRLQEWVRDTGHQVR